MSRMLTIQEIAKIWECKESQVTRYCRDGRIEGAIKENRVWKIPEGTEKPIDNRKNNIQHSVHSSQDSLLPLPIGVSSYKDAATKYYYIDKTFFIKEFLDERPKVSLFTRPRRFGKTLTMDMLRTYFEIAEEDTSILFQGKAIWNCAPEYREHQGKYPVIFLSFKDVKCSTWEETYHMLTTLIRLEFIRHKELANSDKISFPDYYHRIRQDQALENEYALSLKFLSQMLHEHYGIAPIIIIDEYDTPIQQGYSQNYYDKIIGFMRNLFSGGLKDNDEHLSFGFLTGILRVAKESIFSGLNNLKVNSVLDKKYSQYFGFTSEEVKKMAAYYHASNKYKEICEWYDGYRFGNTEIFNPWSVINYFSNECVPLTFWQHTGNNEIIGEILEEADEEIYELLQALLQGEQIYTTIDTSVIYPEIKGNPDSIFSFLLVAGYLNVLKAETAMNGDLMCTVALPNKEIHYVYNKEILSKLQPIISKSISRSIGQALYKNDQKLFQKNLQKLLIESVSYYDTAKENFYHGLILGLCAMLSDCYYITSNRESGTGRYDIQLSPKTVGDSGILIELKAEAGCTEEQLEALSRTALQQISDRKYNAEMKAKQITTIYKYGVAFSGKSVKISSETDENL